MPRALSSNTKRIYWWAWHWPWASAKDIARVTGIKENTVSNALRRGEKKLEWFVSARLGRTSKAVDRYVFTKKGIEEMGRQFGLEPFWWHAADSVRALARRLEVLEMAYRHLPGPVAVERRQQTPRLDDRGHAAPHGLRRDDLAPGAAGAQLERSPPARVLLAEDRTL